MPGTCDQVIFVLMILITSYIVSVVTAHMILLVPQDNYDSRSTVNMHRVVCSSEVLNQGELLSHNQFTVYTIYIFIQHT